MTKVLELVGLKKSATSVELFRTWHTYVALAIGLVVALIVSHIS